MSLQIWFHSFFRPKITSVRAVLYENGREVSIAKYPDSYLPSLLTAINDLWVVEKNSPYWFETEVFEQKKCFQKKTVSVEVGCFIRDMTVNGYTSKYAIPPRYKKKMFDKPHLLRPEPIGQKKWTDKMEVRFVLPRE